MKTKSLWYLFFRICCISFLVLSAFSLVQLVVAGYGVFAAIKTLSLDAGNKEAVLGLVYATEMLAEFGVVLSAGIVGLLATKRGNYGPSVVLSIILMALFIFRLLLMLWNSNSDSVDFLTLPIFALYTLTAVVCYIRAKKDAMGSFDQDLPR